MARTILRRLGAALGASAALFWAADVRAQCDVSLPFGHVFGGHLEDCRDSSPVAGFAYALDGSANSATSNIICEHNGEDTQGSRSCSDGGSLGDGVVSIDGNWGGIGIIGCPNPAGISGVGRNVFVVIDNSLQVVILSVGYSPILGVYAAEFAHPAIGPFTPGPLRCGDPASRTIRLDGTDRAAGHI